MRHILIILILIILALTTTAQHKEMPVHFPVPGIDTPGLIEETIHKTPIHYKPLSYPSSKGNYNCIDTLYSVRYNTNFYDVLDSDSAYFISGVVYNISHQPFEPDNPTLLVKMKVDYSGQVLWQYVDSMMWGDHFTMYNTSIIQTEGGNFVQMGVVINDYGDYKDYDIRIPVYIKFNTNGDTILRRKYVDTAGRRTGDWPQDIIAEDDGGFTVAALIQSDSKTYSLDTNINWWYPDTAYVALIRYDSSGNEMYRKRHFVGGEKVPISIGLLLKQDDGGYIVGGVNKFNGLTNPGRYYIFKVDSLFNWQWRKTFGRNVSNVPTMEIIHGSENEYLFSVARADTPIVNSGGFIYYTGYHQTGIMDSLFNIVKDTMFAIKLAPFGTSGGYYKSSGEIKGLDTSNTGDLVICDQIGFSYGAHLMQLDRNFNIKWNRWLAYYEYWAERPYKMRRANDGGYLIVGMTFRSGKGGWFVKTDTNGFALPGGADTLYHIGIEEHSQNDSKPLLIYPNPGSEEFYVKIDRPDYKDGILEIYDLSGRLRHKQSINAGKNRVIVNKLVAGMYLVKVTSSNTSRCGKLIIQQK